jgi:pimeloyl-ACP methyl ester carboxylesterase
MKVRISFVLVPLMIVLLVPCVVAQVQAQISLPADLKGQLNGVPYRIMVPANWNGTLLVYAHGYGETPPVPLLTPLPTDVSPLLANGFALAASRFAGAVPMAGMPLPTGMTVKEGIQNTLELTHEFSQLVGTPTRTIIWGKSMGGLITLALIEQFPEEYDGAIALCAPDAGTQRLFDQRLDITLSYAALFDWNPVWGTPGELRNDLNFMTEMYGVVLSQMTPANKGKWEFIRLVNRIPIDSFYAPDNNRLMNLYMAIMSRLEMEHRAGGRVAQNVDRVYKLTDEEKTYLAGLGVDANEYLARMNEKRIYVADPQARQFVEQYYDPTGLVTRPLLTIHTTGDPLAVPSHERAYALTVQRAGHRKYLLQEFTTGTGHCSFTTDQNMTAVNSMMQWLDSGKRPGDSLFPPELGFVPDYTPPLWPSHLDYSHAK